MTALSDFFEEKSKYFIDQATHYIKDKECTDRFYDALPNNIPPPDSFYISRWVKQDSVTLEYHPGSIDEADTLRKTLGKEFVIPSWDRKKVSTFTESEEMRFEAKFNLHEFEVTIRIHNASLAPGCKIEETEEVRTVRVRKIICPEGKITEQPLEIVD